MAKRGARSMPRHSADRHSGKLSDIIFSFLLIALWHHAIHLNDTQDNGITRFYYSVECLSGRCCYAKCRGANRLFSLPRQKTHWYTQPTLSFTLMGQLSKLPPSHPTKPFSPPIKTSFACWRKRLYAREYKRSKSIKNNANTENFEHKLNGCLGYKNFLR